jgi:hypothetical protein
VAKTPTEIKSLARAHTDAAIKCLVGIMKSSTSDPAKVAAANSLMDRGWGKAEQKLEAEHIVRYVADVPEVAENVDEWLKQRDQTLQ